MVKKREIKLLMESSYKNKTALNKLKKLGYILDKDLSSNQSKVFVGPDKKPHIALRGTQTVKDVITDAKIIAGVPNKNLGRLQKTKRLVKAVDTKYGNKSEIEGHSLGGFLAEHAGKGHRVNTFNKLTLGGKATNPLQKDYKNLLDPVSILTPKTERVIVQKSKSLNPFTNHSIDSFFVG
jgi:hypothetical protein